MRINLNEIIKKFLENPDDENGKRFINALYNIVKYIMITKNISTNEEDIREITSQLIYNIYKYNILDRIDYERNAFNHIATCAYRLAIALKKRITIPLEHDEHDKIDYHDEYIGHDSIEDIEYQNLLNNIDASNFIHRILAYIFMHGEVTIKELLEFCSNVLNIKISNTHKLIHNVKNEANKIGIVCYDDEYRIYVRFE